MSDDRDAAQQATRIRVTVPASSANLGSGFDTLAIALSLHDTVDVEVVDGAPRTAKVHVEGQGRGVVPLDDRHLVVRALRRTLDELACPVPALSLRCNNVIPHSRGLGSSAAAIVAGVAAAHALAGFSLRDKENASHALHLAAAFEGHADNVAASLLGGLVIAWHEDPRFRAVSLPPHDAVRPVALVPHQQSATKTTRGLLPEQVPHSDAVFTASRAALAVHAFTTDPELLLAATDDRLHQDYREPAWPETVALVRRLRSAGIPAAVSGAGPTVLALPPGGDLPSEVDPGTFTALSLPVDRDGVRVSIPSSGPVR